MKYWEILLVEQTKRKKLGLSIPFLIGSQRYLNSAGLQQQTISELIIDIAQSDSFETCLRYCISTNTLVLEIRRTRNAIYFPKYKGVKQENLSVAVSFDNLGGSIEELIIELENRFQGIIDKKLFSAIPNVEGRTAVWQEFTEDDDIPFIINSFKKL